MNDDMLNRITEMASALMSPDEIAILIDLNPEKAMYMVKHMPDDPFTRAYMKGRLQTKLELRKKVIQLAKLGSPQAEVLADKYLNH